MKVISKISGQSSPSLPDSTTRRNYKILLKKSSINLKIFQKNNFFLFFTLNAWVCLITGKNHVTRFTTQRRNALPSKGLRMQPIQTTQISHWEYINQTGGFFND